jgi:hypothetical protein
MYSGNARSAFQLTSRRSLTSMKSYNLVVQDLNLIQSGRGTGPKTPRQPPGESTRGQVLTPARKWGR